IADGITYAKALRAHRDARNEQVLAAVKAGASTLGQVVSAVYPDVPLPVRMAARMTVTAHVEYLEAAGLLRVKRGGLGMRLATD
ncbi:MAG: hypothetical protein ABI414_16510, partial [Devosia sp.]